MSKKVEEKEEQIELEGLEIEEDKKVKDSESSDEELVELTVEDRIVNIEKRTNIILVLVIIGIALTLMNTLLVVDKKDSDDSSTTATATSGESTQTGYDTSKFDTIKGSDIESLSKGKTIVVLNARQSCGYCVKYAPVIEQVQSELGFTTKYLDLESIVDLQTGSIIDQTSKDALYNLKADKSCVSDAYDQNGNQISCNDFINQEFGATPLTLVIKDNKLVYALAGYVDAATLKEKLQNFDL